MDPGYFAIKFIQMFKENNQAAIKMLLVTGLRDFRVNVINDMLAMMPKVDGKLRLKALEILMEDGQPDLIPVFMKTLMIEKNALYAKSMLLLYGNYESQEALTALLKIENELHPDLKSTFQRVTSKFKARFRENFYMDEFDSGIFKRTKFAADIMIKEPKDCYYPFLYERLKSEKKDARNQACRVLSEIGNQDSIEPMLSFLKYTQNQRTSLLGFKKFIDQTSEDRLQLETYLSELSVHVGKTKAELVSVLKLAQNATSEPFMDAITQGCGFTITISDYARKYLKHIIDGSPASPSETTALLKHMDERRPILKEALFSGLQTLATILLKHPVDHILEKVESLIPHMDPDRNDFLLTVLVNCRTEAVCTRILSFIDETKDAEKVEHILDALIKFEYSQLPEILVDLAFCPNSQLRAKSQAVIAQWGLGDQIIDKLMTSSEQAHLKEGLRLIQKYKIAAGLPHLYELLTQKLPESAMIQVFAAMSQFPSDETGEKIKPFIEAADTSYTIRTEALSAYLQAGGPRNIPSLFAIMNEQPAQKKQEVLEQIITIIKGFPPEINNPILMKFPAEWISILNHDNEKVRDKTLVLLENCKWQGDNLAEWIEATSSISTGIKRNSFEVKRIETWKEKLRRQKELIGKHTKALEDLNQVLKEFENAKPLARDMMISRLAKSFVPEILADQEEQKKQLFEIISSILSSNNSPTKQLHGAIVLTNKIHDPELITKTERHVGHSNEQVANEARALLKEKVKEVKGNIRSIFILDDSRYITKQLTTVLLKAGYQAIAETHVRDGFQALKDQEFDLLILDLNMPEMDGLSFLAAARKAEIAPEHILIISSSRDRDELAQVIQAGVEGLFLKPFPMNDLLSKIQTL